MTDKNLKEILANIKQYKNYFSDDIHTKTGAMLILSDGTEMYGTNHFPGGVFKHPKRLERPTKYMYCEHAERDVIYACARHGISTEGAVMVLDWFPCTDCARAIVMAGIDKVYCKQPDWENDRYGFKDALQILIEAEQNIEVIWIED